MSERPDPELWSFITNVCKPPKNVDLHKLYSPLDLFGLKSCYGFVIMDRKIYPIACLLFYLAIKTWENLRKDHGKYQ